MGPAKIAFNAEVVEVNDTLAGTPKIANADPYGEGWMLKVKPAEGGAFDQLLTRDAYLGKIKA